MINVLDALVEIIAFICGSLISLAMSWYFYKKADFPSKVTSAIVEDVLVLLIQNRLGVDFRYHARIPKSELPHDLSVPHILQYWMSDDNVEPGQILHLLFRVEDIDFDFPGPESVEITELESNVSFSSKRQGHGYYWARVNCPRTATPGWHTVKLTLNDTKENTHSHLLKFEVKQ